MNKQKFVAELSKLLGFMSTRDRQAAIEQYSRMFDEAEDVNALLAQLGSPTRLAISLARDYVPSSPEGPAQEEPPAQEDEPGDGEVPEDGEAAAVPAGDAAPEPQVREAEAAATVPVELSFEDEPAGEEVPAEAEESGPVFSRDAAVAPEILERISRSIDAGTPEIVPAENAFGEAADAEEPEEEAPVPSRRRVRPVPLVLYILLSLGIGLPIAVVLIALGIPVLAAGGGVVALAVWAAVELIGMLSMVSDILLVLGAALLAAALGLLLAWLGLWISLELGYLWIGRVIFNLGGRFCFRKEVAEHD